jgi:hypothetical protein
LFKKIVLNLSEIALLQRLFALVIDLSAFAEHKTHEEEEDSVS